MILNLSKLLIQDSFYQDNLYLLRTLDIVTKKSAIIDPTFFYSAGSLPYIALSPNVKEIHDGIREVITGFEDTIGTTYHSYFFLVIFIL